jgi:response regulator NasT
MRILIAEDETIIRLDLRDLLERAGHEIAGEARDGEEAVALAHELEPDLAIMDVKMPRLDGIEAASASSTTARCRSFCSPRTGGRLVARAVK